LLSRAPADRAEAGAAALAIAIALTPSLGTHRGVGRRLRADDLGPGLRLQLPVTVDQLEEPGAEGIAGDGVVEDSPARPPLDVGQHRLGLLQEQPLGLVAGGDAQGDGVTVGIAVVVEGADDEEEGRGGPVKDGRPVADAHRLECARLDPEPALAGHVPGQDRPLEHRPDLSLHQRLPLPGQRQRRQGFLRRRRRQVEDAPGRRRRRLELEPDERRRAEGQQVGQFADRREPHPPEHLDRGVALVPRQVEFDRLDEPGEVGDAQY
jgi:hypothetical protein